MAPNPRRLDARLQQLYDRIPSIECRGLCYDACGPIEMSVRERDRIRERTGQDVAIAGVTKIRDHTGREGACLNCNMLDGLGRCSVYDLRPMICRLWGVSEPMPCPYGCRPERMLTSAETAELLMESLQVGGHPEGYRTAELLRVTELLRDPHVAAIAHREGKRIAGARAQREIIRRIEEGQ